MRKGWDYKKLGEVCEIIMGQSPDGDSINENEGIEFHQGKTCFGDRFLTRSNLYTNKPAKFAKSNSVLLCVRAPVGFPNITERRICIGRGLCSLSCKTDLLNMFLYYSLLGKQAYFEKNSTGSTFKAISSKIISNTDIPVPSLAEQQSIVSELDKINELISLKKAQLSDLDTLAQSIFYEMFGDPIENEKGWEVKKLGEIGEVERGAGISKKDFVDEGLPCIHYGQLHTILGPVTKKHYTSIPNSLLPKYKTAQTGDLIMAITSEDVEGSCKSTAWLGDYNVVVGSDAAILHHKQDGTFLSYYTMTKAFYNEKAKYAKGFKVTHISAKEIESIPIYLPPLPLQQSFARKIEAIELQKTQITATIKDLETLLASRMQYWFD